MLRPADRCGEGGSDGTDIPYCVALDLVLLHMEELECCYLWAIQFNVVPDLFVILHGPFLI